MEGASESMRRLLIVAAIALTFAVLPACATVTSGGSNQPMGITSIPSRAIVKVNGREMGTTPVVLHLPRKTAAIVALELQGYEPYEIVLSRSINGWFWVNIPFFPLGMIVDASTGAMYKLTPERISVEMRERRWQSGADEEGGIYIFVMMEPDVSGLALVGTLVRK